MTQIPVKDFTQCPNCQSTKRVAGEVLLRQIEAGKMPKTSIAYLFTHQSVIAAGTWLSAPMIISYYDVCEDCGTVYCIHVEERVAVAGAKPPAAGQFGGKN